MQTVKKHVSVIICVYTEKRWHDLVDAVASLQQQSAPPREIIVVVDHNTSLLRRVREELPGVIAVENCGPQGLSGARNSGLAIVRGELIAFLDDDATAEPDWLARLIHCCEDPRVMGAGGTVEPHWLGKCPAWFPHEFYWVIGCSYQSRPAHPVEVRNPYGGCTCIRREVFAQVGGFRNGVGRIGTRPLGGEETELSIRARQHWPQKIFLYEPQARIHHRIAPQRTSWRYFCSRCYAEGLSKAIIVRYVGGNDGLSSERAYVLQDLPRGVLRNLLRGVCYLDLASVLRAGAIVAGLLATAVGYLVGLVNPRIELQEEEYPLPLLEQPQSVPEMNHTNLGISK